MTIPSSKNSNDPSDLFFREPQKLVEKSKFVIPDDIIGNIFGFLGDTVNSLLISKDSHIIKINQAKNEQNQLVNNFKSFFKPDGNKQHDQALEDIKNKAKELGLK